MVKGWMIFDVCLLVLGGNGGRGEGRLGDVSYLRTGLLIGGAHEM